MTQLDTSAPPDQRVAPTFKKKRNNAPFLIEVYRSPVGMKWVMAITGIMLLGYVLVHMIGNLHLYEGPEQVNSYAEALRNLGGDLAPQTAVLWVLRVGLIAAFIVHIHAAYSLTYVNWKARPQRYQGGRDYVAANFAARTMRWTGTILLLYLIYHLADLTWGIVNPDYIGGDVYNNVVESLSFWPVTILYLAAMVALTIHIFHGAWSLFQSLGLNSPRYNSWRRGFAIGFALIVGIGNLSFPIAVQAGLISQDDRCWPTPDQIAYFESQQPVTPEQIQTAIDEGAACPFQDLPKTEDEINKEVEQQEQLQEQLQQQQLEQQQQQLQEQQQQQEGEGG